MLRFPFVVEPNLNDLPEHKRTLLEAIRDRLSRIAGVRALALGGSHARGTARTDSDLDIGVYYRPADAFRIAEIRSIASEFAQNDPVVTGFYEWGPSGAPAGSKLALYDWLRRARAMSLSGSDRIAVIGAAVSNDSAGEL